MAEEPGAGSEEAGGGGNVTPTPNRRVGQYEIVRQIGRGGMAIVYLARQARLDRDVALKELSTFHATSPDMAERFLRESRLAGSLNHPNIVTVLEYFEEGGVPYIAMEYLPRGSLRPYVGRLSLVQFVGAMEGILAALAQAEASRIVHRDLKPENIMATGDGRVKITDFGIAKGTESAGGIFLTATGTTVGTPSYMAPEQAMGEDVGMWTDLYSVGVMAWEHMVGRVPFHDSQAPMVVLMRQVNEPIPSAHTVNPEVDPDLSAWIDRLLVKDPHKRTQSALAAWDELEDIVIHKVGPRWRREARLPSHTSVLDTPRPLTPAPFESQKARTPRPEARPKEESAVEEDSGYLTFEPGGAPATAPPPPAESAETPATPAVPLADAAVPIVEKPPVEPEAASTPAAQAPVPVVEPVDAPPVATPPEEAAVAVPPEEAVVAVPPEEPAVAVPPEEPAVAGPPVEEETPTAPPPEPTYLTFGQPKQVIPEAPEPSVEEQPSEALPEPEPVPEAVPPPPEVEAEPAEEAKPEAADAVEAEPAAELEAERAEEAEHDPELTAAPALVGAVATPEAEPIVEEGRAEEPAEDMPAGAPDQPRPRRRVPLSATAVALAVLGVIVAAVVGFLVAPTGTRTAGGTDLSQTASQGPITVSYPADWSTHTAGSTPGVSLANEVAVGPNSPSLGRLVIGSTTTTDPSLLPASLLSALPSTPTAQVVTLGHAQLYRYLDQQPRGASSPETVYALPTTIGTVIGICELGGAGADLPGNCERVLGTLKLSSGRILGLGPNTTFATGLTRAISALNTSTARGQASLHAAPKAAQQSRAAQALAAAYDQAASAVARLQPGPAASPATTALVRALAATGRDYGTLAQAAAHNDTRRYGAASAAIAGSQSAITAAFDQLSKLGYLSG